MLAEVVNMYCLGVHRTFRLGLQVGLQLPLFRPAIKPILKVSVVIIESPLTVFATNFDKSMNDPRVSWRSPKYSQFWRNDSNLSATGFSPSRRYEIPPRNTKPPSHVGLEKSTWVLHRRLLRIDMVLRWGRELGRGGRVSDPCRVEKDGRSASPPEELSPPAGEQASIDLGRVCGIDYRSAVFPSSL
jgi:hypothetical protein